MASTLIPPTDAPSAPSAASAPLATPDAIADSATHATTRCANCGADGCEQFCPRCGQETHDLHRSLAGILGELLDVFAGWDGKIPHTLWLMVRHPGALTSEFLGGRRARYLRPLRLYLTMSVAFFLSLTLLPSPSSPARGADRGVQIDFSDQRNMVKFDTVGVADRQAKSDSAFQAFLARNMRRKGNGPGDWLARRLTGGIKRLTDLPKGERSRVIGQALLTKAPNMVFLLLPVFALLTRLLYRRQSVFYAEHFVFALHNHAFGYFALTLAHLASVALRSTSFNALKIALLCWMPIYFFIAMRRVYGGSRRRTAVKFVALGVTYGTILSLATFVTALIAIVEMA